MGQYIIGVSSGVFGIAQPQEKLGYIDLSQKGFYSAFKGVNFTQIDLETSAEFIAPDVSSRLEKLRKEMNVEFGIHGLMRAMGANGIFLDSAIREDWQRTHFCLSRDIERSGKVKAKYLLQHASETPPYDTLGKQFQPTDVVDIWGRPLYVFLQENSNVFNWLIRQEEARTVMGRRGQIVPDYLDNPANKEGFRENAQKRAIDAMRREGVIKQADDIYKPEIAAEINERANEMTEREFLPSVEQSVKEEVIEGIKRGSLTYGSEKIAYLAIAKWMSDRNDPLWKGIVGDRSIDSVKNDSGGWVPAVSLKYIYGHFFPEEASDASKYGYKNLKPLLNQYQLMFVIETETGKAGDEEVPRAANPAHFVMLCKEMESKGVTRFRAAVDFEHCLGAGLKPMGEGKGEEGFIDQIPAGCGKYVGVLHLGWPTALGPAHVPIFLGSEQQEWLYKWIYALRKKGFTESEDRFLIFERAGGIGGDPVDQSTMAIKKIVEFLRNDVRPEDLTKEGNLHFYGYEDSSVKMQEAEIAEHFMDPIKGLLQIPEEQHGFLGGAAVAKGKAKEWEAGKMR